MKRSLRKWFQTNILPFLMFLINKILFWTNKIVYHFPNEVPKEGFILACWHGELLMQSYSHKKLTKKQKSLKAIVSEHSDGKAIGKMFSMLGVQAIKGSSSKGGAKALIAAIKEIKKGSDIAITPDGPRGPRYSVADGIVAIAQKTNSKIMAFNYQPSKYWQLNSWDKFVVPKPFGTIHFYVSEPFSVDGLEKNFAKEHIQSKMMENALK